MVGTAGELGMLAAIDQITSARKPGKAVAEDAVFAGPARSVKKVMKKASPPSSATMAIQRAKTRLRSITSPAAASDAAKPIAPTRMGPTVVEATALVTRG